MSQPARGLRNWRLLVHALVFALGCTVGVVLLNALFNTDLNYGTLAGAYFIAYILGAMS